MICKSDLNTCEPEPFVEGTNLCDLIKSPFWKEGHRKNMLESKNIYNSFSFQATEMFLTSN